MINIIDLGFGKIDFLTLGIIKKLENSEEIFLNKDNKEIIDYLKEKNVDYRIINPSPKKLEEKEVIKEIIKSTKEKSNVSFGVLGSPLIFDNEIRLIIELCTEYKVQYKILNSYNFMNKLKDLLGIRISEGYNLVNYNSIKDNLIDKRFENIIFNINEEEKIEEVKEKLLEVYNNETDVILINYLGTEEEEVARFKIEELDLIKDFNGSSILYLKKDEDNKKDFKDLINLVETLRGEKGCPWDIEQDNESIKNDTLEEVYELIEAINNKDIDNIIEELGDVLFHVVFHASVGKKENKFNISDVLESIINKMVFRHPHVFGEGEVNNSNDVLSKWEELKKKEKKYKTITDEMKNIAKTLPALIRANKIQKKAAKVGFDFEDVEEAAKKVMEELKEVLDVYKSENKEKIYNEVGDLIFSCINISRMLEVNEEEALNFTIQKFINRFSFIENEILKSKRNLNEVTMKEMDSIWEKAKNKEK